MNYLDELAARRRLTILRLMIEEGGQSNDGSLVTALRAMGDRQLLDQAAVRGLMRDLEARACVAIEIYRDTMMVGRITERGRMAAAGDVPIGGIASPHQGL